MSGRSALDVEALRPRDDLGGRGLIASRPVRFHPDLPAEGVEELIPSRRQDGLLPCGMGLPLRLHLGEERRLLHPLGFDQRRLGFQSLPGRFRVCRGLPEFLGRFGRHPMRVLGFGF
jgi:hypothetical protein